MGLQEKIKSDMIKAMKEKNIVELSNLRVICGEMERGLKKILSDDEVIDILKKLKKYEKESLEKLQQTTSNFMKMLDVYLPKMATEEEIKKFAINLYKNGPTQVGAKIGAVMKHFGKTADGNIVKKIIDALEKEKQ